MQHIIHITKIASAQGINRETLYLVIEVKPAAISRPTLMQAQDALRDLQRRFLESDGFRVKLYRIETRMEEVRGF